MAEKKVFGRTDRAAERNRRDYEVAKDPDIRGASKGRLGLGDDYDTPSGNHRDRVERAWKREGKSK